MIVLPLGSSLQRVAALNVRCEPVRIPAVQKSAAPDVTAVCQCGLRRSIRRPKHLQLLRASRASSDGTVGADTTVEQAWRLLKQFNSDDMKAQRSPATATGLSSQQRKELKQAVLMATTHAWPEAGWDPAAQPSTLMLGVLSGDVRLAVRALRDYAHALGFEFVTPQSRVPGIAQLSSIRGGVYIKANVATRSAMVSEYSGSHRGVLLQLGQQQIGHLPLGLFDAARSAPPPPLP